MILAGIAVTAASAYADENESQDQQGQGQEMRQGGGMMRQGGGREGGMRQERSGSGSMERRGGGGLIDQYLRTDLTKADMDALKVILDQQREAMKTLADSLKAGTITQAEFVTQAKALRDAHVTAVSQYVAADKLEAFKAALAAMPLTPPNGRGQGGHEGHDRMDNGSGSVSDTGNRPARETRQAKLLPASIGTKIDAKLAALANDAARADWLNAVIAKVEALEAKAKSKKAKSLFSELKDLLNEKLDAIDGTVSDASSIDSLIQ